MSSRPVVVRNVHCDNAAEVSLAKHDEMVETVPPDRADQPFDVSVLPWRSWRRRSVADAHGVKAPRDDGTVGCIAITDEVSRGFTPRECLGELLRDPFGGRICGDVGPDEPSPFEVQDDEPVEQLEPDCRYNEEIDGGNIGRMIA